MFYIFSQWSIKIQELPNIQFKKKKNKSYDDIRIRRMFPRADVFWSHRSLYDFIFIFIESLYM